MERYFTFSHNMKPFVLFSPEHLIALGVLFLMSIGVWVFRAQFRCLKNENRFRIFIGMFMMIQEISLHIWRVTEGTWNVSTSIPLHVCSVLIWTIPILLFTKSEKLFNFLFLLGIASSFNALLTPDMEGYGFPNYKFYQYFISHGLIFLSLLYMTFVHSMKPKLSSIKSTMIFLNLMLPFVMVVNYFTKGNYMFLAAKPAGGSLIDFFGPWPLYIIPVEFLAILMMYIVYILFRDRSTKESL